MDRSSWNFFHHVYSDILSCGCLRGDAEAGSLLDVFLYLSFFPKVISGPIVQWKDFQKQTVHRQADESAFLDGLNRIMIGFAKSDSGRFVWGCDQPDRSLCRSGNRCADRMVVCIFLYDADIL